jgi:hypothetical protein
MFTEEGKKRDRFSFPGRLVVRGRPTRWGSAAGATLIGNVILSLFFLAGVVAGAEREVRWSNGEVELAGVLLLPAGEGPHPAAVILHGSGTADRHQPWARTIASVLVGEGLAVLLPDKRGSGGSNGDWREADFEDLAFDALTGARLLRGLPEIDGARIGLVGLAQGGHVVSVAAAQDSSLAFVVDLSGGAVTMAETVAWEVERAWRREGAPEEGVALGLELLRVSDDVARGTGDWETYRGLRRRVEEGYGAEAVASFPDSPDDPYWSWWGRIVDFDPMTWWWTVDVPVLFLFGSEDERQPTGASVERIEVVMVPEGLDVTVRVFAGAGHALTDGSGSLRADVRRALAVFLRRVL